MDIDHILKNTTSYEDDLIKDLKDPDESRGYLEASLDLYEKDGDTEALLLVMRDVTTFSVSRYRYDTVGELT